MILHKPRRAHWPMVDSHFFFFHEHGTQRWGTSSRVGKEWPRRLLGGETTIEPHSFQKGTWKLIGEGRGAVFHAKGFLAGTFGEAQEK